MGLDMEKLTIGGATYDVRDNSKLPLTGGVIDGTIWANKGVFNELIATTLKAETATIDDLTAQNATVVGLLDVQGEMHTNQWTNANIANVGGSFYIAPTVSSNNTMTITIGTETVSGTTYYTMMVGAPNNSFVTDAVKIYDSTHDPATYNPGWPIGSRVMVTGNIRVGDNGIDYPLGTLTGYLTQALSGTGFTLGRIAQDSQLSTILTELGITNPSSTTFKSTNISISMYEIGSGAIDGILKPVGIMMTSYGVDKATYLDIYGGVNQKSSDSVTGQTDPNLRIGYLGGLSSFNVNNKTTVTPTGWGIYTDNGFFKGVIAATSGIIGGFDIGQTDLHNGTLGGTNSVWVSTGTSGSAIIGGSELINNWAFTASNNFGVTTDGTLYATGANIAGHVTMESITVAENAIVIDENALISNSAIETGGRNLLRNTGSESGYRNGSTPSDLTLAIGEEDGYYKTLDISASWIDSGSSCTFVTSSQVAVETLVKNKFYTLSMYVMSTVARSYRLQLRIANENNDIVEDNDNLNIGTDEQVTFALEANTWTKISRTFKVPNDVVFYNSTSDITIDNNKTYYTRSGSQGAYTYSIVSSPNVSSLGTYYERFEDDIPVYARLLYGPSDNGCTIYVKEWKLERGNQDTDWVPAVEDMAGKDEIEKVQVNSINGSIVSFETNNVYPLLNETVFIEPKQPGSGDPSPSNVRPISGHTDVVVSRTGKNLFNPSNVLNGYINASQQKFLNNANARTVYTPCKPNTTYTVSKTVGARFVTGYTHEMPTNNSVVYGIKSTYTVASQTVTTDSKAKYIVSFVWLSTADTGISASDMLASVQIELNSSATTYEAYNGDTYTTALGTTVYGGTLDAITGILTITHKNMVFSGDDTEVWQYYSVAQGNLFRYTAADRKDGELITLDNVMCDRFKLVANADRTNNTISSPSLGSEYAIDFIYDECTSVEEWKTWLASNNIQVIYPLATPKIIQLSTEQITTLIGYNTIWSDAGNISVTYANFSNDLQQTLTNIRDVSSSQLNIFSQETNQRFGLTDEQISMARTVATNYIDAFTTDGIYIHNIRDEQHPDNPSIYISNNQIDLIRNGKSQVVISSNGLSIYNAIAGDNDPIAQYGIETIIGKTREPHVQIKNNKLSFYEGQGTIPDAYLGDNSLYINRTITTEVAIGSVSSTDSTTGETRLVPDRQWSWKVHNNLSGQNNLGLRWGG